MPPPEEMMQGAAQVAGDLKAPELFEATAIGALANNSELEGIISKYTPTLEDAIDHLGRILLVMWINESKLKTEMGDEDFSKLESKIMTVFKNLGALLLQINSTALPSVGEDAITTEP
jgi:hypothetical protein